MHPLMNTQDEMNSAAASCGVGSRMTIHQVTIGSIVERVFPLPNARPNKEMFSAESLASPTSPPCLFSLTHRACINPRAHSRHHIDNSPGASQCGACAESGRECRFETDIRFKHSHARQAPGRSWAKVPSKISFVTPQGIDGELSEPSPSGSKDSVDAPQSVGSSDKAPTDGDRFGSPTDSGEPIEGPIGGFGQDVPTRPLPNEATAHLNPVASPSSRSDNPDFALPLFGNDGDISLAYGTSVSGDVPLLPPSRAPVYPVSSIQYILGESPPSQLPPPETPSSTHMSERDASHGLGTQNEHLGESYGFTERQAFLFMTYIHKLAPSSDACDDARHFTLEVPRLAFQEPMIMNGLLALASRYDARCSNSESDLEGTYYHNRCIELLIEAFARPPETWDSRLLTAVVIARLYEEYDNESDSYYHHLSGTRNLLNHEAVARFVTQGGLAEAASWVHLRQAIYVYLVRREPVEICLENFERSTVFRRNDDSAYANRAVYLFAKMMKLLFPLKTPESEGDAANRLSSAAPGPWELVEMEVGQWYDMKPLSFKPIYHKPADVQNDRPFPAICIAASVPVVAMQHYYAAKAIICLRKCNNTNLNIGYHAARLRRDWEQRIAAYLCTLMGLALSNEHVVNAFYLPAHMLSLCGYCIRHPCERAHTVRYLHKVDEIIKWKTKTLIETLETEWAEMDNFEK
ncbi:hypothetical protein FDECE_15858 [Fusarium decemcellulare]|nr:hypothetical protein FDECE_15858 [Fusarium decemcellulare]